LRNRCIWLVLLQECKAGFTISAHSHLHDTGIFTIITHEKTPLQFVKNSHGYTRMTDTRVNDYGFKRREVYKRLPATNQYPPSQSDLTVGHHCLSPCPSVESSRVASVVLTSERKKINNDLSMCYIITAFLGYPDYHATDRQTHIGPLSWCYIIVIGKSAAVCTYLKCRWLVNSTAGHCDHVRCQKDKQKNIGYE
jgi:hypothetical protein